MRRFSNYQNEALEVHKLALKYKNLIEVPQELITPPKLKIIKEAKRVELRLVIEATVVIVSGMIPSGLLALYLRF